MRFWLSAKKMAASEASSRFEAKTSLCCAIFALVFFTTRRQIDGKSGTLQIFFFFEKIVSLMSIKFAFICYYFCICPRLRCLVQGFWRWNKTYCSFATCVCYWPITRSMLWTRFQAVFTLFPNRHGKAARFPQETLDCVVKIERGTAEITGRNYSKRFSAKRFTLTLAANDTSNVHPETWAACKAKLY